LFKDGGLTMAERLTINQRETLRVLSDGEWYDVRCCADVFRRTFPALIRRDLLNRRGGGGVIAHRQRIEVAITDAGLRALNSTEPHHG
jgi:hypothetical protein